MAEHITEDSILADALIGTTVDYIKDQLRMKIKLRRDA